MCAKLYLDCLCSQANIMEAELLHAFKLLLLAQAQRGIEDVDLALCVAHDLLLKCWRHKKQISPYCDVSSMCRSSSYSITAPGKACVGQTLSQALPASCLG